MSANRLTISVLVLLLALTSTSLAATNWSRPTRFSQSGEATPDLLGRIHARQTAAALASTETAEAAARAASATAEANAGVLTGTLDRLSISLIRRIIYEGYLDEDVLPAPFDQGSLDIAWDDDTDAFWADVAPGLSGSGTGELYSFNGESGYPYREPYYYDWEVYVVLDVYDSSANAALALEEWGPYEVSYADAPYPGILGVHAYGDREPDRDNQVSVARLQVGPVLVSGVFSRGYDEDGLPAGELSQTDAQMATDFALAGTGFLESLFIAPLPGTPIAAFGTLAAGTPAAGTPVARSGSPNLATPIAVGGTPRAGSGTPQGGTPHLLSLPASPVATVSLDDRAATNAAGLISTATVGAANATATVVAISTQAALATQAASIAAAQTADAVVARTQIAATTSAQTAEAAIVRTQIAVTQSAATLTALVGQSETRVAATRISQTQVAGTRVAVDTQTAVARAATGISATATAQVFAIQTSISETRVAQIVEVAVNETATSAAATGVVSTASAVARSTERAAIRDAVATNTAVFTLEVGERPFSPSVLEVGIGQTVVLSNTGTRMCYFSLDGFNDRSPAPVPARDSIRWTVPSQIPPGTYDAWCDYPSNRRGEAPGTIIVRAPD